MVLLQECSFLESLCYRLSMTLPDSLRVAWYGGKDLTLAGRFRWFMRFRAWKRRMLCEKLPQVKNPVFTAIIPAYKRPQNIRPIVESLLRTPEVKKVIISNNNCRVDLSRWFRSSDLRVTIIEQVIDRPPLIRQEIALRDDGQYFIVVDDDLFLLPSQISTLCRAQIADSSSPHAAVGEVYDSWMDRMHHHVTDYSGFIDIVNRAFTFTRGHLDVYFALRDQLASGTLSLRAIELADDVITSFSGTRRPRTHAIGSFLTCPTSGTVGIAAWRTDGFFPTRLPILFLLRKLRPLP